MKENLLDDEAYFALMNRQDHKCAMCQRFPTEVGCALVVDREPASGAVKGLVCPDCKRVMEEKRGDMSCLVDYLASREWPGSVRGG